MDALVNARRSNQDQGPNIPRVECLDVLRAGASTLG